MYDELCIGPTPVEEPCVQVGSSNYRKWSLIECRVFVKQLERLIEKQFKEIFVTFRIKSSPHEYGTYHEVYAYYDPDNPDEVAQAFYAESHTPEEWDDEARQELESYGYPYKEICNEVEP